MAARPPIPQLQAAAAYGPNHDPVAANLRGYGPRSTTGSRPNSFVAGSAGSNVAGPGALLEAPSSSYASPAAAAATGSSHSPNPHPSPNFYANYNHARLNNYPHHNPRFHEDFDAASQRGSVVLEGPSAVPATSASAANTSTSATSTPTPTPGAVQRSASQMSQSRSATPSRSSTLKKRSSLSKRGSMRRSGSRKSLRAGSVRSLNLGDREKYGAEGADDVNSAFAVPIPTDANPTDALANRFQSWRKILKDLIVFFKELQKSYEMRSKLVLSASNVINNSSMPSSFLKTGGLSDATEILRDFHRQGYLEANKAAEVESEVVNQLMGLRNDLQKKTKEIKSLASDFKNSVDKEVEGTRKTVRNLHEALGLVDTDPSATSGRGDPFIVRLGVDKQIEKQIEEENYLHRAYHNLENSGRELESIVVGEIQKAYNAYANILKREADGAYDTAEKLHAGPISMPQDHEWNSFVANTDDMVNPHIPLRNVENVTYPGKDHPAAAEVRSGMLERKSKYLKSYTPGWYVLSPTHLHEFKSADRVSSQTPVMSLYLPDQKLGSHSEPDSTSESHKFMLKGRKTGAMRRGHSWVFRAESHETMMSWYEDIESLISKTGEARNAFVRRHTRTTSGNSVGESSRWSELMEDEDEADRTPYSRQSAVLNPERPVSEPRQPGGRFPSDVQIDRHLQVPLSPSSGESSGDRDLLAAVGSSGPDRSTTPLNDDGRPSLSDRGTGSPAGANGAPPRPASYYGDWIGPAAVGARQQENPSNPKDPNSLRPELEKHNNHASSDTNLVATAGVMFPQEPSTVGRRARRESASTAPTTTNMTDLTNNTAPTVPTSIDDAQDISPANLVDLNKRQLVDEMPQDDQTLSTNKLDGAAVGGLSARNFSPARSASNGVDSPAAAMGEDLKPAPTTGTTATTGTTTTGRTKGSVSTLELKIPGHYPPPNVAV